PVVPGQPAPAIKIHHHQNGTAIHRAAVIPATGPIIPAVINRRPHGQGSHSRAYNCPDPEITATVSGVAVWIVPAINQTAVRHSDGSLSRLADLYWPAGQSSVR